MTYCCRWNHLMLKSKSDQGQVVNVKTDKIKKVSLPKFCEPTGYIDKVWGKIQSDSNMWILSRNNYVNVRASQYHLVCNHFVVICHCQVCQWKKCKNYFLLCRTACILLACFSWTTLYISGKLSSRLSDSASTTVAVKVLKDDMSNRKMRENFEREVKTISSFDHENILHLLGVVVIGKRLFTVALLIFRQILLNL